MRIVAIDTSERQFSVAALESNSVVAEIESRGSTVGILSPSGNEFHSEGNDQRRLIKSTPSVAVELFPMISELLRQVAWRFSDVELVAVTKGPGSFTGLRSGIVAAKTLAYVGAIPIIAVNTLHALAFQLVAEIRDDDWNLQNKKKTRIQKIVHCVINAQRNQLFVGKYRASYDILADQFDLKELVGCRIMDVEPWIGQLDDGDWVTGTGLKPLVKNLQERPINIAPHSNWLCRASSIGRLALKSHLLGHNDNLWSLEPFYFRPSYADEKLG